MEDENEELHLAQPATDGSARTSTPMENYNHNKIRRRNVPESMGLESKIDDLAAIDVTSDRVPVVILPDSTKAWYDGTAPRISDFADVAADKQRNGVLTYEEDRGNDYSTTDILTSRERMKMSVIRGSIVNPDLTLGELRLLGCSSEGFVNGTLLR